MKDLWKLKYTLYCDEDYECVENYKVNDDWKLFAKKGQVAERIELTDENRGDYCAWEEIWRVAYAFNNGNYVLCQDDYSDDFTAVN